MGVGVRKKIAGSMEGVKYPSALQCDHRRFVYSNAFSQQISILVNEEARVFLGISLVKSQVILVKNE